MNIEANLSAIEADESLNEVLSGSKHLVKLLFLQRFSNFMKNSFRQVECLLPNNQDIKPTIINGISIDDNIAQYFWNFNRDRFNLRVIITDDVPITPSLKSLLNPDELFNSGIFNIIGYKIGGQIKEISLNNTPQDNKITVTDFQGYYGYYDSNTVYQEPEIFPLTLENYNQLFWGDNVDRYVQLDNEAELPNYLVEQRLFQVTIKDDIPVYLLSEEEKQNGLGNDNDDNDDNDKYKHLKDFLEDAMF